MIHFGLRNNIPSNTLYNNQIASIIFMCAIVFKISSLPGIVATEMMSSTSWVYIINSTLDLSILGICYYLMRRNADEFLMNRNSIFYKVVLFLTMIYLCMKSIVYFAYTTLYLSYEIFLGTAPVVALVIFILPIVYLGIKGIRTIGRCCEIFAPILFLILLINLSLLDTNMDFPRNLPFFAVPPKQFFTSGLRYGVWFADFIPLIFIKMQKKKVPYIGITACIFQSLVILLPVLGLAIYGDALPFVTNMIVRLASFNRLSLEIGRLEWTSVIVVIVMALTSLSYFYWATTACSMRIFGTKKPLQFIYPIMLLIVVLVAPSARSIGEFSIGNFGYFMTILGMGIPLTLLAFYKIKQRIYTKKTGKSPDSNEGKGLQNAQAETTLSFSESLNKGNGEFDFPNYTQPIENSMQEDKDDFEKGKPQTDSNNLSKE